MILMNVLIVDKGCIVKLCSKWFNFMMVLVPLLPGALGSRNSSGLIGNTPSILRP